MPKLSVTVISEKMFASYAFSDKNQKPLRRCRMQITKQAVAILSLISGNDKKLQPNVLTVPITIKPPFK